MGITTGEGGSGDRGLSGPAYSLPRHAALSPESPRTGAGMCLGSIAGAAIGAGVAYLAGFPFDLPAADLYAGAMTGFSLGAVLGDRIEGRRRA